VTAPVVLVIETAYLEVSAGVNVNVNGSVPAGYVFAGLSSSGLYVSALGSAADGTQPFGASVFVCVLAFLVIQ